MSTYIALLRGINVSGQKIILMADLKKLFESLKFSDVQTLIQSGNVVFKSEKGRDEELVSAIEKAIAKKYAFQVPVIVRSFAELEAVLKANPFRKLKLLEKERVYISFLSDAPAPTGIKKLESLSSKVDEVRVIKREVYLLCRGGYGKTQFSNALVEKCLVVKSTTRNLETTQKLLDLATV